MNKKSLLSLCLSAGILTGVPAFNLASEVTTSGNPPASATALPAVAEPAPASAAPGPAAETVAAVTSDNARVTATSATENSEAAAVDPSSEADADPAVADADSETEPDAELSSDADVTPEETATATPEVYDAFAADPFTGSPLLRMKRRLEAMAATNGRMQKSAELALAVAASASENRYFRRNCEYLTRLIRRAPFPALASTLVFPEFLGIANELMLESTRAIINISIEDLQHNPQKRLKLLNELAGLHQLTGQIAQLQRKAMQNVKDLAASLTDQARRRAVGTPPADLLKKGISEISQLLDQAAGRWGALLNQHDHHRALFSGILDYLVSANDTLPAVRHAAQLNQMLRSLLDFKISLEDFYGHVSASPARLGDKQQTLSEKLESLAARSNQFRSRVAAFNGRFPARENDPAAAPAFSCADELTEIFSLLEKMQAAKIVTGLSQDNANQQSEVSSVTTAPGSETVTLTVPPKPANPIMPAAEPAETPPETKSAKEPEPTTISEIKSAYESDKNSGKETSATSGTSDKLLSEPAENRPEVKKSLLEELIVWLDGNPWPVLPEKNEEGPKDKSTNSDNNKDNEKAGKAASTPDSSSADSR